MLFRSGDAKEADQKATDAIWPLIGHLTWFCDFCRELVQEINGVQSLNPGVLPSLTLAAQS